MENFSQYWNIFFCALQIYTYILDDLILSHKSTNVHSHLCFGLFFLFSVLCEQDDKKYGGNFWRSGKMIMDSRIVGESVLIMTIKMHARCELSNKDKMEKRRKTRSGKAKYRTEQDDLRVTQSLQWWINVRWPAHAL